MLKRIRLRVGVGRYKHLYGCRGSTLLKPKWLPEGALDVRDEHLMFLHGKEPKTWDEKRIHALLVHENTHSERQCLGWTWLYSLRYELSRSFRLNEEKLAYHAQIAMLIQYRMPILLSQFAQALSGPTYGYISSYSEALRWVREVVTKEADFEFMIDSMIADEQAMKMAVESGAIDAHNWIPKPPTRTTIILDRIALVVCATAVFAAALGISLLLASFGAR